MIHHTSHYQPITNNSRQTVFNFILLHTKELPLLLIQILKNDVVNLTDAVAT